MEWRIIPELENYMVSQYGNVKNIKKDKELVITNVNGYNRVVIRNKTYLIHRLVALCFLDNVNNYGIVHHKDNNKRNNDVSNLEWNTQSYNVKKAYVDGLISDRKGINNPNYKNGKYISKT